MENKMTWEEFFAKENEQAYYVNLMNFVDEEYKTKTIFPPRDLMFKAFELTPFDSVRVVIIGQDPYYRPGQAMGLAFSVPSSSKLPPSLKNIYKEIANEYHRPCIQDGDLTYLALQGVLLLNTCLTVEEGKPLSHKGKGYEYLLNDIIKALNDDDSPKVFILWGGQAQSLKELIKNPKHLVLMSPHPSPLSAYNGFWNNNHFLKTNEFLLKNGFKEISWIKKDCE